MMDKVFMVNEIVGKEMGVDESVVDKLVVLSSQKYFH